MIDVEPATATAAVKVLRTNRRMVGPPGVAVSADRRMRRAMGAFCEPVHTCRTKLRPSWAGLALTRAQAFERPGVANGEPSAAEFDDARGRAMP